MEFCSPIGLYIRGITVSPNSEQVMNYEAFRNDKTSKFLGQKCLAYCLNDTLASNTLLSYMFLICLISFLNLFSLPLYLFLLFYFYPVLSLALWIYLFFPFSPWNKIESTDDTPRENNYEYSFSELKCSGLIFTKISPMSSPVSVLQYICFVNLKIPFPLRDSTYCWTMSSHKQGEGS